MQVPCLQRCHPRRQAEVKRGASHRGLQRNALCVGVLRAVEEAPGPHEVHAVARHDLRACGMGIAFDGSGLDEWSVMLSKLHALAREQFCVIRLTLKNVTTWASVR